ncbi:hypothetical protein ACLOJK_010462 [Asimina triloba]
MFSIPLRRCAGGCLLRPLARRAFATSTAVQLQWPGLQSWRDSSLNQLRKWGSNGPQLSSSLDSNIHGHPMPAPTSPSSLAEWGALILSTTDPLAKSTLSHLAYSQYRLHNIPIDVSRPPDRPSRPLKPPLVSPKEIPAPKNSGLPLNAYMLHNLAHVELNAIDLAWDTVVRFSQFQEDLGEQFFADFAHVADDESRHFGWCSQRLGELGFKYGDMPAHNLLWRECERSSGSVAARLAVIPLVQESTPARRLNNGNVVNRSIRCPDQSQEARGLDAGPRLIRKLIGFGDHRTSDIVAKIADEEVAHVAVGVFWFLLVCQKMGHVPCATFKALLKELDVELKGPFNYTARDVAGIPRDWYDGSSTDQGDLSKLSEVYDRLACIVSMEKENSNLHGHSQ